MLTVECSNEDKKTGLSGAQVGHKWSSRADKCQRVSAKVTQLDQVQQGSGSAKEVVIKNKVNKVKSCLDTNHP